MSKNNTAATGADEKIDNELYQDRLKEYRQLEQEIAAFNKDMYETFKRQQNEVSKYESENKLLAENKSQLEQAQQRQDKEAQQDQSAAVKIRQEIDAYKQKIDKETQALAAYDDQAKQLQREIIEQKKRVGGTTGAVGAERDHENQLRKSLKRIQSRLDSVNLRYSEVIGQNKNLREQIDQLRRDRLIHEQAFAQLEKKIGVRKKNIALAVEEATLNFNQRDVAIERLQSLQNQDKQALASNQQNNNNNDDLMQVEEIDESSDLNNPSHQHSQQPSQNSNKSNIERMQDAISKDSQSTQASKFDSKPLKSMDIAKQFVKQESAEFNLFKTVSDLKQSVEQTETQIMELHASLDRIMNQPAASAGQGSDADTTGTQLQRAMVENTQKKQKAEEKLVELKKDSEKTREELMQTIIMIKSVGNTLQIEAEAKEIIGSEELGPDTIVPYMSFVEQKVGEITAPMRQAKLLKAREDAKADIGEEMKLPDIKDSDGDDDSDEDIQFANPEAIRKRFEMNFA